MQISEKKKRIILVILLLLVVVAGAFVLIKTGKKSNVNTKPGVKEVSKENKDVFFYKEELIGKEIYDFSNQLFFSKFKSSSVKFFSDNGRCYLMDMKTKDKVCEVPNKEILLSSGYWIDKDNNFWTVHYDKEKLKVIVNAYNEKGDKVKEIELKDYKGIIYNSCIQTNEMRTDDLFIYVLSKTRTQPVLQIFTKNGELKHSYENVYSFDVDGKGNCFYSARSTPEFPYDGIFEINSNSGEEICRNTSKTPDFIRYNPAENMIYGVNIRKGRTIDLFSAETGDYVKSIFEFGKDSTYTADAYAFQDFMVGDKGELYFSLGPKEPSGKDDYYTFYAYQKEMGKKEEKAATLTITAPYRNDFMADAIARYELKYPEEKIKYDYMYNDRKEFSDHKEEYAQKLTLNILSGEIGDIVLTGGSALKYKDLAQTDAFTDLTPYLKKDANYGQLNKSVLNGLKIKGAVRALPLSYIYYQIEVNEDLAKKLGLDLDYDHLSWSEVLQLAGVIEKKAPEAHLFYIGNQNAWDVMGEYILIANMPDLIDFQNKKVNLNQKWFKELIKEFKDCSKSKNFINRDAKFDLNDNLHGSLFALSSNAADTYYGDKLGHFCEYNKMHQSQLVPMLTGEKANNRIGYSTNMYSINNRSAHKDEAWKFLSFLLQEDVQSIKSIPGMPINQKAVEKIGEDAIKDHAKGDKNAIRFNKEMNEISQKIDFLYDMDYLKVDIDKPIQDYLNDKITLDEAIKKAEENVMIRLNE